MLYSDLHQTRRRKSPNISVFSDDRTIFGDRDNPPKSNTEERTHNGYICSIHMRKRKKEMAQPKKLTRRWVEAISRMKNESW